jgi:CRP/FNR family cyclic AMP-dependent transcriptional regulator
MGAHPPGACKHRNGNSKGIDSVTEKAFTPLMEHIRKRYEPELRLDNSEFEMVRFEKGRVVFLEGAVAREAYLLKKGRIEISVKVKGRKVPLTTLEEKTVFGEMALVLKEHRRTATATAVEDSELVKIPKNVFDKYINASPRLISTCLFTIAGRLQSTTQKASKSPDTYEGIAQIMNLMAIHGQWVLSYDETLGALARALLKDEAEIADHLSLMASLNLIELKSPGEGERMIHLSERDRFLEKALNIFGVLKRYQTER